MIEYYSAKQVAEIFHVHYRTVHNWHKDGKFVADIIRPDGRRFYSYELIDRWKCLCGSEDKIKWMVSSAGDRPPDPRHNGL